VEAVLTFVARTAPWLLYAQNVKEIESLGQQQEESTKGHGEEIDRLRAEQAESTERLEARLKPLERSREAPQTAEGVAYETERLVNEFRKAQTIAPDQTSPQQRLRQLQDREAEAGHRLRDLGFEGSASRVEGALANFTVTTLDDVAAAAEQLQTAARTEITSGRLDPPE
jgi:muconolactone delta-isomerase